MKHSLARRLLFSALVTVAVLLLLEGGARLLYHPEAKTTYDEHQQIIDVLGLPQLNSTMTYDPMLFWKLLPNLDHHHVSGRIREQEIDFDVTTNSLGLRTPPLRSDPQRLRILAVGDSCTFGLGVADEETWPAVLEKTLNRTLGGRAEVVNVGVPGYTSYQGKRYLETTGLDLRPDLVIVSFGFNDADTWSSRTDVQTARRLRARGWAKFLAGSRFFQALGHLLQGPGDRKGGRAAAGREGTGPPRVTPEEFHDNLLEIHRRCAARDVPVVYLIWPYRSQVRDRRPQLMDYQPLVVGVGLETGSPTINLIEPFLAAEAEMFLDHVHASPAGCRVVARTIAAAILASRPR